MAINKTFWASYKGRESIVERFIWKDKILVREIWPNWEPREMASIWDGCGLVELDREVWLTTEEENNRELREDIRVQDEALKNEETK